MENTELTTKETAARLGVTTVTIQRWIDDGAFPNAYKLNPNKQTSPFRIPESDIDAFLKKRQLNT